ncbi:MAG: FkbM family methyltransferase [Catonella sp.]|nr:FkbM family methyltransferase [Catonella sp.]
MVVSKVLVAANIQSQYDAINYFCSEMYEGFKEYGIDVDIYDSKHDLKEVLYKKYDLVVNVQGFIEEAMLNTFRISSNTPVLSIFVDHPMYHTGRILNCNRTQFNGYFDRKFVSFVENYFPNTADVNIFFPHGGAYTDDIIPYENREYDIVFIGGYTSPDISFQRMISNISGYTKEVAMRLAELLVENSGIAFEDGINYILQEDGKYADGNNFAKICSLLTPVDKFHRSVKRKKIIDFLSSSGFKVDVYGSGWENYDGNKDNVTVHDAISYTESVEVMRNAKITLCSIPNVTDGSHERVFSAAGLGSIPMTDYNNYFSELFEDEKNIIFYDINKTDGLKDKIAGILYDNDRAEKVIKAGRTIGKENSWRNRSKQIVEFMKGIDIENTSPYISDNAGHDEFSDLCTFIASNNKDTLYNKVVNRYLAYGDFDPQFISDFEKSMHNYAYWGDISMNDKVYDLINNRCDVLKDNLDSFIEMFNSFNDETSRLILTNILRNWITFDPGYLSKCMNVTKYNHYFDNDIIIPDKDEVFVDLGAYTGDSAEAFYNYYKGRYKRIYAVEAMPDVAAKLRKNTSYMHDVEVLEYAVGKEEGKTYFTVNDDSSAGSVENHDGAKIEVKVDSLDNLITAKITFIKSDIEKAEYDMLHGARNHIINDKPKLAISVYHGSDDLIRIWDYIHSLRSDYKYYLRYYGGNLYPNEIVLYCV